MCIAVFKVLRILWEIEIVLLHVMKGAGFVLFLAMEETILPVSHASHLKKTGIELETSEKDAGLTTSVR